MQLPVPWTIMLHTPAGAWQNRPVLQPPTPGGSPTPPQLGGGFAAADAGAASRNASDEC
jgi:hypothetical protein